MNKPRHKYTSEDEGIIRRDYSGSKKSAESIAMKIGVTYTAIQSKAQSMAICKYRPVKKWTQQDKDNLKELVGKYPPHKVAKIMDRPLPSIMNMVYKSGIRTRCFRDGWYTKEDACIIFGVNHRRVQYYIDNNMLKATHHNGHKDGYHTVWHISKKDMKLFICKYPEELNGRNVDLGQVFDILGVLDPYKYNVREKRMTLSEVVVKCAMEEKLVVEFNRLSGCNLDFTLHKPKSGLEMMIDQATGYDDIAQLSNRNKSDDIKKFIAFVADAIYVPWMSELLNSLPMDEIENDKVVECKRCGECCLSTPCIFAQVRHSITKENLKPCPDLVKIDGVYSCKLIESDKIIKGILIDGMCDKLKDKEKVNG